MHNAVRKEWERQAGETARAFQAFLCYLETRSHKITAQLTGHPLSRVYHWSTKHKWQARACAYDAYTFEQQRAESNRILHQAVPLALQRLTHLLERGDDLPPQLQVKVADCILRYSWLKGAETAQEAGKEALDPFTANLLQIQQLALEHLRTAKATEGVE